ncbi:flagellar basal-body rod modification protein FlgD [Aneurinibacillus soli]|uniref:Basal-body rod modification protein FlgD n=1 Tax=Aneurinibacillus soli TaxID=1500254 RepID=A0A0U4WG59_9BACL|nr:flagellar hook assembly protein FlgD [Aneurinibacillus soli]PYE63395.1 flagellar basal-body rod modification protein FlgD [Aneurinibacillus soli]BAU27673.1 Basal-body rod modification protein FlgD [Aneurinibacillus soli]
MPIIDTTMYKNSFQNVNKTAEEKSMLGKDDFLRILVTQLQNQDPTQPLQDREFIAQMAQFSTLEQMTNMNKMMSTLAESQTLGGLSGMIGKNVTWTEKVQEVDAMGNTTYKDVPKQGVVKSVSMKDGTTQLIMEDDAKVAIGLVETLTNPTTSAQTNQRSAS